MQFEGAVIREQGVTFAVVIVKRFVIQSEHTASEAVRNFGSVFPGLPVVLMAQDSRGRATFYGRADLTRFLARVPLRAIPWKRYSYS